MIVPQFAAAEGDTCPEDTARRFVREYDKLVDDPIQDPIYKTKKLIGWYASGDAYQYYKAVLQLLESGTQEITPAPINNTTGGRKEITNSIRA